MIKTKIVINKISAEKFWSGQKSKPKKVKVSSNVNILDLEKKGNNKLKIPFMFSISYNPSIAQINFKGEARIGGKESEIESIIENYQEQDNPPSKIVQKITNKSITEATILSRTLNVPPPIPLPSAKNSEKKNNNGEKLNYVG